MIPAGTGMEKYTTLRVEEPEYEKVEIPIPDNTVVNEQTPEEVVEVPTE